MFGTLSAVTAQGCECGSSPCQHLRTAGLAGGAIGLSGRDSYLFYAMTTVAWLAQRLRPDALVHVMNENVCGMREEHRRAMVDALGL